MKYLCNECKDLAFRHVFKHLNLDSLPCCETCKPVKETEK